MNKIIFVVYYKSMRGGEIMKKLLTLGLLGLQAVVMAPKALAVSINAYGVNDLINQGANLGKKDLRTAIAGIINVILGFLGVIAVVIVLLGGFKWMTSQGSSDKIDEAKKLIGAGVVGLAIVLASFAVASFVLTELYNATNS